MAPYTSTVFLFLSLTLCLLFENSLAHSFINPYRKLVTRPVTGDPGEPLFITPYLESGNVEEAQNASLCNLGNIESHSGYFTVNKTTNSNMFFWYFPAETRKDTAPVVLWLQGGPGATSLHGLFMENGPFFLNKDGTLEPRKFSWHKQQHLIYIDNPVGTGYSFADSEDGYAKNEVDVGENLYRAIQQFLDLFPNLRNSPFYVTGESYAGKYVPALSYTIHKRNPQAEKKINFQGLAIGNGLSDPENQLLYSSYLYQLGLIDDAGRTQFEAAEKETKEHIEKGEWTEAFSTFDNLLNGDLTPTKSLFYNLTGFSYYFNYLESREVPPAKEFGDFVQTEENRKALHVGNSTFHTDQLVEQYLLSDVMQSVRPWIEELVSNYRVLIYNGQLDIIVAYPLTENYLKIMEWAGREQYLKTPRYRWCVGEDIAGYYKSAGLLTEVLVRNAGHMVPTDQPKWAYDLITRFTYGKAYRNETC